jgi:hypothetical protein
MKIVLKTAKESAGYYISKAQVSALKQLGHKVYEPQDAPQKVDYVFGGELILKTACLERSGDVVLEGLLQATRK